MKHLFILAVAACLVATTAQAQSPSLAPEPAPASSADRAAQVSAPPAAPANAEDKPRLSETHCVRHTGSRIRQRDAKTRCNGQPGRSYTKDDLGRTGQTGLAGALRTLDPSIR